MEQKNYIITYKGQLRCEARHLRSETDITTDAPVDNNGKGEQFSPTDLVATGLTTCILTVMGIYLNKQGKDLSEVSCEVRKIMASDPRRIQEIQIEFDLKENQLSEKEMDKFRWFVHHCPVSESLHPDIKVTTNL